MKVKELIKQLSPKTEMTFEIIEERCTHMCVADTLLDVLPSAAECEIIHLSLSIAYNAPEGTPFFLIEASNKLTSEEILQMSTVEKLRYCGYTEEQILKELGCE